MKEMSEVRWTQPDSYSEHVRQSMRQANLPKVFQWLSELAKRSGLRTDHPITIVMSEEGIGNDWSGTLVYTPWSRITDLSLDTLEVGNTTHTLLHVYDEDPSCAEYAVSSDVDLEFIRDIARSHGIEVDNARENPEEQSNQAL